jgi:hypothetical protein
MPFTPDTATGRPRGAENKETKALREAIAKITEGSVVDLNECFGEIRQTNPAKFIELYLRLLEYSMPKLRSVDATLDLGDSTISKVTIEVNTKPNNEGA